MHIKLPGKEEEARWPLPVGQRHVCRANYYTFLSLVQLIYITKESLKVLEETLQSSSDKAKVSLRFRMPFCFSLGNNVHNSPQGEDGKKPATSRPFIPFMMAVSRA